MTNILWGQVAEASPPVAFWSWKCKMVYGGWWGKGLHWCQNQTSSPAREGTVGWGGGEAGGEPGR